ncbi:MAG: hypothetical protein KGN84_03385 [Acidobacteriota bacterium]|nr:hypothetical protein [Acidobacteriota bacterium]
MFVITMTTYRRAPGGQSICYRIFSARPQRGPKQRCGGTAIPDNPAA